MSTAAVAPWEKYSSEQGPWNKYGGEPNIASESEMAAHSPVPTVKPVQMTGASPTVARLEHIATHQRVPSENEIMQGSVNAGKFGAESLGMQVIAGPLARVAETHVLPALKAVPWAGKAVSAIEEAPGVAGKVLRGATVGGVSGGVEGVIRGKGVAGSAAEAGKGALFGAGLGLALPTIHRLAGSTPERLPVVSDQPFALDSPIAEREPSVQDTLHFPKPPTPEPERLSPISDKPFALTSPPAASEPAIQNSLSFPKTEQPPVARGRLAPISAPTTATAPGRLAPISKAPSVDAIVNQATGAKPLKANVPLREQVVAAPEAAPAAAPSAETDPMKLKYPDPAVRQMVRANGEAIVQKVGDDPETMKAIHDLTRVELRQALINSGEDMGQVTVSNSKFAGEGSIGREEAFNRLLKKNISPKDIVNLAKKTPESSIALPNVGVSTPHTGMERRTSLRDINGPEPMRNAVMNDLRTRAGAGDTLAQRQLDDMLANPFERHEGGDINSMKVQKTMSREDAEANTQERLEGRKRRFGIDETGRLQRIK